MHLEEVLFSRCPSLELTLPIEFFTMLNRLHIIKTNKQIAGIPPKILEEVSKNHLNLLLIPVLDFI